MENLEQNEIAETKLSPLHTVTPLSKYLAMALFIALPFVGGWIGYAYAPEKVVEIEKIITVESEQKSTTSSEITTVTATDFINTLDSPWPSIEMNYLDISQPPPWAYYSNGTLVEQTREMQSELRTGVPSEVCDFIQKQSNGSWLLNTDVNTSIPWSGREDAWVAGTKYGNLQYLGFECSKHSIEFYFEGEITMRGTTYYPDCYSTCKWFNPNSEVAEQLSFIFDLSESEPIMASQDLDNIVMSAHFDSGQRHTADLTLKTNKLRYKIGTESNGVDEAGQPTSNLWRWVDFPINGYQINSIEKESF